MNGIPSRFHGPVARRSLSPPCLQNPLQCRGGLWEDSEMAFVNLLESFRKGWLVWIPFVISFHMTAAERVAWTTSRVQGSPEPPPPYRVMEIYPNSVERRVVDVQYVPGGDRLLALHLGGMFRVIDGSSGDAKLSTAFDFKAEYSNLFQALGFTFDPNFTENRLVYVCFSRKSDPNAISRIVGVSRFELEDLDSLKILPESHLELLQWEVQGHNGGCLTFGPDGYLYISVGDGRPPSPPDALHSGQDITDLRASILRVDVSKSRVDQPYSIPSENPFLHVSGARPEVWAYGFRNPWRMSFHDVSGELWLGDVGWEKWEMIHRVKKGGNYGWSVFEGSSQSIHPNDDRGPSPISAPVYEYPHAVGRSVTGGYFYFGDTFKDLRGAYIFGDFESGKIYALREDNGVVSSVQEIADTGLQIISFARAHDGEILVVGYDGGLFRLMKNEQAGQESEFPRSLSATGIFDSVRDLVPARGVYPYEIVQELFEPNRQVDRVVALPGFEKISEFQQNMLTKGLIKGEWQFPINTVFARTVSLGRGGKKNSPIRRMETQVLHFDGKQFQPYNYIWNDAQTDAFLSDANESVTALEEDGNLGMEDVAWKHSSRSDCLTCHLIRTGGVQGFVDWQLDHEMSIDGRRENQLKWFESAGFFEEPIVVRSSGSLGDLVVDRSLDLHARRYLHTNCAHCHRPQGGGGAQIDLRYDTSLDRMGLVGERPLLGDFSLTEPALVVPGSPSQSVLFYRMAKLGAGHMPRLGSSEIDYSGLQQIGDWIVGMNGQTDALGEFGERTAIAISQAQGEQRQTFVEKAMASSSGSLALLRTILSNRVETSFRQTVVEQGVGHQNELISGLFEGLLPPEERRKRLGDTIDASLVLSTEGNPDRGRRIFLGETGIQCVSCHSLDGAGKEIGPELDQIGGRLAKGELLDSLLFPSDQVGPEFALYNVELLDEQSYSGMIVNQDLAVLSLRLADGRVVWLSRGEIASVSKSSLSLMPEGLLAGMTLQDAADLLSFLEGLK
jgi:putative heme-binding domain-containing protein